MRLPNNLFTEITLKLSKIDMRGFSKSIGIYVDTGTFELTTGPCLNGTGGGELD